jgi:hypothetical protein
MTTTSLDRTPGAGDAGRVTGERQERPDPEVPERARRRTFTAQYKQQVLAAYEAAPDGEKGAVLRRPLPGDLLVPEQQIWVIWAPARCESIPAQAVRIRRLARVGSWARTPCYRQRGRLSLHELVFPLWIPRD